MHAVAPHLELVSFQRMLCSAVNFQFGVIDVFLKRESAIQCYTKVDRVGAVLMRCSRPSGVKGSVCFPVPEMERAGLGLRRVCV